MELDDEEFESSQIIIGDLLEDEGDVHISGLRRSFEDIVGDNFENYRSHLYSSLSSLNLQEALEINSDWIKLEGDFTPVPVGGPYEEVAVEQSFELDDDGIKELAEHLRKYFGDNIQVELTSTGGRYMVEEDYSTGISVFRELGRINDLGSGWASVEVSVPVAYLTPEAKELTERDLGRYNGKILEQEYLSVIERSGNMLRERPLEAVEG